MTYTAAGHQEAITMFCLVMSSIFKMTILQDSIFLFNLPPSVFLHVKMQMESVHFLYTFLFRKTANVLSIALMYSSDFVSLFNWIAFIESFCLISPGQ